MKKVIAMCVLLALLSWQAQAVKISQVLYWPADNIEAVELSNDGKSAVDVSGWVIATETSGTDAVIPAETVLKPGQRYVIADPGWEESRPVHWASADLIETLTLANSDAGVALLNGTQSVDAVGWGDAAAIDEGLYRGTPHQGSQEGQSLVRVSSTDNNSEDFVVAPPLFLSDEVLVIAQVDMSGQAVNLSLPDDDSAPGVQWIPFPGENRTISIEAPRENMTATFNGVSYRSVKENQTPQWKVILEYTTVPGEYVFEVVERATYVVEVLSLKGLSLETMTVAVTDTPTTMTVANAGNVPVDLELSASTLQGVNASLPSAALEFSVDGAQFAALMSAPSGIGQVLPGQHKVVSLRLDVGAVQTSGTYVGSLAVGAR
ncbi:hypothetical protein GF342_01500 [Candidatus Woesearchaeota archaeon]|nr:hypothetical protein [Candidatus Woesearchaeota archaeon]